MMRVSRRVGISWLLLLVLLAVFLPGPATAIGEGTVGRVMVDRISGTSRIATAVAVSEATFESAETVVISRADQFADALVGAVVAAENDAPILLVNSTSLPSEVSTEIARLGATQIIILGGTNAVSGEVSAALSNSASVRRLAGDSRFATAAAAAAEAPNPETVFLAAGGDFPDALSAAPYAAFLGNPILLTSPDSLPAATADMIEQLAPSEVVVLGGVNAVSEDVFGMLDSGTDTVRRVAGASRWETSAAIFDEAIEAGMSPSTRWLATGQNFPDALAAGPAVAAEGHSFLLVPGDNLSAAPVVAERIASDYCNLAQLNLLGGTSAITGDAVTQLESILPTDTNCPGPGPNPDLDSFVDCTSPSGTTISDLITDLDPDGDPDGDGFTTAEETGTFAFDPVADPARFNPLVSDVPQIRIDLSGDINLELVGTLSETDSLATTVVDATERTDTTQDIDTTETTESHTAGGEVGLDSTGLSGSANYSYTNSTTNTTGTITTDEFRESNSVAVESSTASTTNVDNGRLSFEVTITNAGHVDFRMEDVTVNVSRITGDDQRIPVGAASAAPDLVLNEGATGTPLILSVDDIPASSAIDLAQQLTGLEFVVSTFTLSEIGKGDIRTDAADFSQYQQRVRQNTAAIGIDAGPSGQIEQVFVSTTFDRNADGTPAGVPLCEALRVLLGKDLGVVEEPTGINGSDVPVQVLTSMDQRIGSVDVDFERQPADGAYWITDVGSGSIGQTLPFGLDNVNLRAGDAARFVYYEDRDFDGLDRIREVRTIGTSDDNDDTDGDNVGDFDEVTAPYSVTVIEPQGSAQAGPYDVFSDPTAPNVDGDGWDDGRERTDGTDPNRADTDGDGLNDDLDRSPLDGSTGAELVNALGYWPLDLGNQDPNGGNFIFPDERGGRDAEGTANQATGSGPVLDRNGVQGSAWAGGRAGVNDDHGILVVPRYDDTTNWDGDEGFTIAGWFSEDTPRDTNQIGLIAGSPAYMGLWLSGGGNGTLVLGPLDTNGSHPGNIPGELRYDSTPSDRLLGSGWTHVAGTAEPTTQAGNVGVQSTLYINGEEVATQFFSGANLHIPQRCAFLMGNYIDDCSGNTGGDTPTGVGSNDDDPQTGIDDVYLFDVVLEPLQVRELAVDGAR